MKENQKSQVVGKKNLPSQCLGVKSKEFFWYKKPFDQCLEKKTIK